MERGLMAETIDQVGVARGAAVRPENACTPQSAVLIVNTRARRGQEWFAQAQDCLRAHGVEITASHALKDPSRLPDLVEESIAHGAKLVVVGGGDGSFRSVAGHFAHKDVALGVLPLGTVNDLARNLGIADNVEAACAVIAEGHTAQIDLGQANDDYFLITASLGFSAQTQHALSPALKKVFGPMGYLVASVLALRRLRDLKIILKGESEECVVVLQAGVVNGHSWMGGKLEIPGVNLESGRMAFYAVPPQSGISFLHLVRNLMRNRFFHTPGLRAFTTKDITISTETPQPLVLDGDLCGETPVHLHVVPEALTVCVPRGFEWAQAADRA
jgi:diacylglycerol kinase (ATP)